MDCASSLEEIINRCLELGINCIAIADHGTTEGALKIQTLAPLTVIVAQEILTADGEIMGVRHRQYPVEGVQFHPESFMTEVGKDLLRNFLKLDYTKVISNPSP